MLAHSSSSASVSTARTRTSRHRHAQPGRRKLCVYASASSPLATVLQQIDAVNAQDPRQIVKEDGSSAPYELEYSRWITGYVTQLSGGSPSEEVQIAARGQHIKRWVLPRTDRPEGKAAYLQWREDLKTMHAQLTGEIMQQAGYDEAAVDRVVRLIKKQRLKEPEGAMVEDALCLAFLEHQLPEFRLKETREKTVDILRKTWLRKMSEAGRAAALQLPLGAEEASLVSEALGSSS